MLLKSLSRLSFQRFNTRKMSSLISVTVSDKLGVATVELQRPPLNSLNLELLSEISSTLSDLEKNKSRGLILTAKNDGAFCSGLDIMELYKPEKERFKAFWTTLQDTWIKLYGCSFPTVAVINGHAPAAGCLLAISCEYRVMLKNYKIGLNETQSGLVVPKWFIYTLRNVIEQRQTEVALTTGTMFKSDEAFKIGMVDEIVENKNEGVVQAEKFLKRFAKIPPMARGLTKKYIRQEAIEQMAKIREEDLKTFTQFSEQPAVQEYLESLLKIKKTPKA